jgi:2-aminoadipate transaminase
MMANDICQRGILKQHVKRLREEYRRRRDAMLAALDEFWPEGCAWTRPLGGLFLWARLPKRLNAAELLPKAIEQKVAYVPGMAFHPGEDTGFNTMRLNFSNASPEMIREGIRRLGLVIREAL